MSRAVAEQPAFPDLLSLDRYVSADPSSPSQLIVSDRAFEFVLTQIHEARKHFYVPVGRQTVRPEQLFHHLARAWLAEAGASSSASEMAMHPAYQRIIGMGRDAIPLLLRELGREPDHWFWALKAITGVDPVEPAHRGDIQKMAQAWLEWGREQSYI